MKLGMVHDLKVLPHRAVEHLSYFLSNCSTLIYKKEIYFVETQVPQVKYDIKFHMGQRKERD